MSTIDLMSDEENEEFESGASGEEESAEESGEYESGEEEEDDDEDNSDEDDDDDDDDDDDLEDRYRNPDGASVREKGEPIFKYFRLKAVQEILVKKPTESFKCLAAYSKYMVIGGTSGSIYLLDVEGKQLLKEMQPHKKTINEVVIDEREENIASCSDDGTVVISSLDAGANTHDMREPVHSVSLCSNFRVKQEFVSSTGFKVIYHAKAKLFFASKSRKAIHPGDGTPIYSLRWRGNLIAWASAVQVCVFDLETQKLIGHFDIELDKRMRCCLCWKDDRTLISSFKQTIMVHVVEERRNAAGIPSKGLRLLKNYDLSDDESGLPNSTVSGISMFTPDKLLVLTHSVPKKNAGLGLMPELHILPIQGEGDDSSESQSKKRAQLIENDKIPIDKHEANQPDDYRLVPMTTESYFYIVAPKDMILVKPRDCDDHITFLILKEKFRKAYNFARRYVNQISQKYTLVSLGEKYMDKLLKAQKFAEVADLCTNVLRNDPELWERWITKFINHNATNYIVQRIPYGQNCPKLSPGTYEMVIQQFIREDELPQRGNSSSSSSSSNAGLEEERDPAVILKTIINAWPIDIYSPANIVVPLEELRFKMRSRPLSSGTTYLVALANLYVKMGHFEDAVDVYLEAGDITLAIELTDKHGIFKFISNPQKFFEISPQEGAKFAVSHRMDVDPTSIFKQLSNNQHRYEFLSCLFEKDTKAVPELHNTLLELYIQFDKSRKKLEYFLYTSECYNQQEALRKLEQKKYFREMAHIYGRLSQHKKAIEILINNQEDRPLVGGVQHRSTNVRDAVRFIEKHRVDQLWGDLIDLVVGHPDKKAMISDLLVAISGKVDPLLVINKIPPGTKIDNLNMQLSRIINEYRVQISMREDCNQILQTDNFELMTQINKTKSRGTRVDSSNSCRHCSDPIIFGSNNFVVFWCNHVYHVKCLNELQRGMAKGPQERSSSSSQRDPMEHLKRFKCLTCHPN